MSWLMALCRPTALTKMRTRTTSMHPEKNFNRTNWFSIENKARPFCKTAQIHPFLQVLLEKMRGLYADSRKAILVYQITAKAMEASQSLWLNKTFWAAKRMTTHFHLMTSLLRQSLTWNRLVYQFIWCRAKKKWLRSGRSLALRMWLVRRRNTWLTQAWQALRARHLLWCGRNEFHTLTLSGWPHQLTQMRHRLRFADHSTCLISWRLPTFLKL